MESEAQCFETIDNPLQIPKLPESVITEILSRLPVKSLLKFKCVSKSWCSLISSKYFIKTHLQNSTNNPTFSHHRIISTVKRSFWKLEHYSLPSLLRERDIYSFDLDRERDKQKVLDVVGSYNGLICILIDQNYFFLWNPATKESKRLPDFHGGMKNIKQSYSSKYGFGFDESSDDYKVFAVLSVIKPGNKFSSTYQATIAKVYSLKSDSWKRIEFVEDDSPLDAGGKFASGKLHWSRNSELNSRWDIVSFDLQSEAFGIVEQPSHVEGDFYPTLGVLDGRLCVLCDYCKTQLDVWVWNQYGVQDSWVKLVTISYLSDPLEGPLSNPLCILPNGEVLFIYESAFVSYNPKKSWIWYPEIVDSVDQFLGAVASVGFVEFLGAVVYVESLVSLVPDDVSKSPVPDGVSKRGKPRKKGRANKIK